MTSCVFRAEVNHYAIDARVQRNIIQDFETRAEGSDGPLGRRGRSTSPQLDGDRAARTHSRARDGGRGGRSIRVGPPFVQVKQLVVVLRTRETATAPEQSPITAPRSDDSCGHFARGQLPISSCAVVFASDVPHAKAIFPSSSAFCASRTPNSSINRAINAIITGNRTHASFSGSPSAPRPS